jgi:putative nucleotidyltransferase with HDIG domain
MDREGAIGLVKENVSNRNLVNHMIAVGAIMKGLAEELGKDPDLWETTGILHDIDYEETKDDWKRHAIMSAEMLDGKLPGEALKAIKAHNFENTGVNPETEFDYALICADALSGLLVACALVMPSKKLGEVTIDGIEKKFKSKDFARNVKRENIDLCEKLDLVREKFLEIGLKAMQNISGEIGL